MVIELGTRQNTAVTYSEYAECELPANLDAVRLAVEKLRAYCAQFHMDGKVWLEVELAVVEGLNNAIVHGCAGRAEAHVRIRWSWTDGIFEARISDPGNYLPSAEAEAALPDDPLSESGRGGFLMDAMMDLVEHRLVDGRHQLILRKDVGRKIAPVADPDPETASLLQAMIEDLSTNYESLAALFRFAEVLAAAATFDEFLQTVIERLLELVESSEAHVRFQILEDSLLLLYSQGLQNPEAFASITLDSDFVECRVFHAGQQRTVEDCGKLAPEDPLRRGNAIAFACPIRFQGDVLGVLTVMRINDDRFFNAAEINMMRVVAEFSAIAYTTSKFREQREEQQRAIRELEIAASIQQSLLPKYFPDMPKTRVFGVSQASREVGGDYFDVIPVEGKGVLVAIADVMGKGMSAALLATVLRAAIRARTSLAAQPGFLLTEVNRQIESDLSQLDMFITAQVAFFPHYGDQFMFASAGHCPILKCRKGSDLVLQISEGGVPLGVVANARYNTSSAAISSGDRFVFLTDGVFEAESPNGGMLGLRGISTEIHRLGACTPSSFCGRLLDAVRTFSGGAQAADDRTIMLVERL